MDEKRLINAAINDIWKLIKRYYETRQDDAFWKEVVDAGVAISDKYNHHPLVDDFVKDAVMWLDKKSGNDKWWKEGTNWQTNVTQ